ncbi:MAG TPA: adenylate/guanylate cyclase domain-containing protein [Rectinemataceae bacterium]|nr:adenylate/guanylate cyclase domain-containing protein [Rectinemataceae bacterium]
MSRKSAVTSGASEDRLERLIRARLEPGADKERIDAQIWDLFGEDWSVMFTDLSGFSRRVAEFGIIHFLQVIYESERLLVPIIEEHDGILLKVEGDSFLVIFRNARKAFQCSIAMQASLASANVGRAPENRILLCVGLGAGRVLRIGDTDVYGAEVNAASKLGEDTAKAGEILVTDAFKALCAGTDGVEWEALPEAPPGASGAWKAHYRLP